MVKKDKKKDVKPKKHIGLVVLSVTTIAVAALAVASAVSPAVATAVRGTYEATVNFVSPTINTIKGWF